MTADWQATCEHLHVGVNRFEDLRVWQAAKQQCDQVGALLRRPGFLRRRDRQTKQFLRYAIASNGELKAGYYVAQGRASLAAAEAAALLEQNDSIARMLRRWYATLSGRE